MSNKKLVGRSVMHHLLMDFQRRSKGHSRERRIVSKAFSLLKSSNITVLLAIRAQQTKRGPTFPEISGCRDGHRSFDQVKLFMINDDKCLVSSGGSWWYYLYHILN
jgi:hypothetical protein